MNLWMVNHTLLYVIVRNIMSGEVIGRKGTRTFRLIKQEYLKKALKEKIDAFHRNYRKSYFRK